MTSLPDRPVKADPKLFEIEEKLRQGNYLKDENRSLNRLLEDDAALIASLNMDMAFVISQLDMFYKEASEGLGEPVLLENSYEVLFREDRGKIACPWGDKFFAPKAVVYARNIKTGATLRFSVLGLHMLKRHGFFQGQGSPFRLEPKELKSFFEL